MKSVTVSGCNPSGEDEDAVLDTALAKAGEDRSSLFGWSITRTEDDLTRAVVILHTD
jgi:hypothetical protein